MRILTIESPRFPEEGSSAQGKSGPKPRLDSVGDGQSVENQIPPRGVIRDGVTQEDRLTRVLVNSGQAVRKVI